jgi:opacity protein-like surface antigen
MITLFVVGGAGAARAQVGYPPAKSPFQDVEKAHELTPLFGHLSTRRDPAGGAPQGGPLGGLQYEWRASGPLHLGMSFVYVNSERTTLNPSQPVATRTVGTKSEPLYAADAFLALSLTGARSWHQLMPMVGAGAGLITNGKGPDVGGFKFGTRFAFPWSAGLRWVPGNGHLQLRADLKDWMYTIAYPQSYYISTTADTPILPPSTKQSRWTNNFAMTVGVSYTFSR